MPNARRSYSRVVAQLNAQHWAILPSKLDEIQAAVSRILADRSADGWALFDDEGDDDGPSEPSAGIIGETMVIPVRGTITSRPSAFSSGGTSTTGITRSIEAAMSPKVKNVVLDIDSPGGSVFGIQETGDRIRQLAAEKPVHAVANHVAASAAYWLGSQATTFAVSPSGEVGSIGVIYRRVDYTAAMEKAGVKVDYIASGKYKAEERPDVKMSDDERANLEATSAAYYGKFIAAVARGRRRSEAEVREQFATGRMFLADDAKTLGLVDRVATYEQVLGEARAAAARGRRAAAAVHLTPTA